MTDSVRSDGRGRPVGYRESEETREKKSIAMKRVIASKKPPTHTKYMEETRWNVQFKPFGDRVDFLSPEAQHAVTGKLKILPPRGDRKPYGT